MSIRFHSHVTIDEAARGQIINGLNDLLACTVDLASQVKQAHWNVRGEQFISRHRLFDDLYAHLVSSGDLIAERVGQLGGYAKGTIRMASVSSTLAEHDTEAVQGNEHVRSLTERYAELGTMLRHQIRVCDEMSEPVTVDICTEVLRSLEVDLWFLESHLETGRAKDLDASAASANGSTGARRDGDGHRPAGDRARPAPSAASQANRPASSRS
jgi:starvation-inducible DNA-binding protein